jgi:hypothetical protein
MVGRATLDEEVFSLMVQDRDDSRLESVDMTQMVMEDNCKP